MRTARRRRRGAIEQRTRKADGENRLHVAKACNERGPDTAQVPSLYDGESRDCDDGLADAMAGSSSKMMAGLAIYFIIWRAQHGGAGDSQGTILGPSSPRFGAE